MMKRLYLHRDSERGVKGTYEWLADELQELKAALTEFLNVLRRWLKQAFTTLKNRSSLHPRLTVLFLCNRITPDITSGGGENTLFETVNKYSAL